MFVMIRTTNLEPLDLSDTYLVPPIMICRRHILLNIITNRSIQILFLLHFLSFVFCKVILLLLLSQYFVKTLFTYRRNLIL